ncbi:aspartate aminotransferase family protein [Peribacillus muralis]|uniref:aspartate aminotransferase family protein n=1 Tax=Peribacillus muralis TaxID=264697 RepID=UPI000708AFA4|nr:aspartate aminotransferase family protein [Peribacillus muralis]
MKRNHLIKPILDQHYPTISHGNGVYLYDTDGNQYLDGSSGAVTASIGHGVSEVVEAMTEQGGKVSFAYRSHFTSDAAEALAKKLSELAPGDLNWSFFVNSGSEATETAMKIAIQHWQEKGFERKNRIISRWTSYHGITMGALSMSGHVQRRKRFVPLLEDFPSISAPYCYRCPYNAEASSCKLQCANELETAIQRIGSENIAAFIAEPIIGASAGAVTPPLGYYPRIKEICERYDILFIADEVMTGMGRTGKMFAMEHWEVIPDIIALGKGMSAGYTPMAATIISDRVMEPILTGSKSIMAGHTYSANPLSSAISLEVLTYLERKNLVLAAKEKGAYLLQKLQMLTRKFEIIGDVRGKGLLLGLEFVSNRISKTPFDLQAGVTARLVDKAFAKGLLIYPAAGAIEGIAGDAVIVSPPLIITNEEIDCLVEILEASLEELQQELHEEDLIENMQAI